MEFLLICAILIGFYYVYSRQGLILTRLNDIERLVRSIGKGAVAPMVAPESPLPSFRNVERSAYARDPFLAPSMDAIVVPPVVKSDYIAPSSAPIPPANYGTAPTTESPKVATEAQEEKSARWLGRIGGLMIFLGMIFFVNYAITEGWLGVTGQFMLGLLVGVVMLVIGHYLRAKHLGDFAYERFATGLMGGGVAVLYLIIFSGFSILHYTNGASVISQTVAFLLMILVTATTMVLAVVSNSRFLALSAVIGGFLTPIMVSNHENNLIALSLYMVILNFGVMGMGWFKKWSWLNYAALFGTVILFSGWMAKFYFANPDAQLPMTFFFLTIFFFQFLVTAVLYHFRTDEVATTADLFYLTLNSGLYFLASYGILHESYSDFLGFFALLLAVVHMCVAYISFASTKRDRNLNLFLVGVAVVFLSIAIPLQLSGYFIALSWLIEAVVLIRIGSSIREFAVRVFGWIVFVFGMLKVLGDVESIRYGFISYRGIYEPIGSAAPVDFIPFMNSAFMMLVIAVLASYAVGYSYARMADDGQYRKKIVVVMVLLANLLTLYAVTSEIGLKYDKSIRAVRLQAQSAIVQDRIYQGQDAVPVGYDAGYQARQSEGEMKVREQVSALENQKSTVQSVFWALYAMLLLVLGFAKRMRALRIGGLVLIFITAVNVFVMVWNLGQLYRVIATLVFGVLALIASFIYVKYKYLLKEIIYDDNK